MTSILSQPPPVDPRAAREAAQWLTRLHGAVPGMDHHAVGSSGKPGARPIPPTNCHGSAPSW